MLGFTASSLIVRRYRSSSIIPAGHWIRHPAEVVVELAEHPNLIGIKESSGSIEKCRRWLRHASHQETCDSDRDFCPRYRAHGNSRYGCFCQAEGELGNRRALVGTAAPKPSSAGVAVVGRLKTRQKEVGFQVLVGAAQKLHPSLDAGAVGAILAFADCAPTACYEIYAAWKEATGAGSREAGADCQSRRTDRRRLSIPA